MGEVRKVVSFANDQSKYQKKVILEAQKGQSTVHFASLMDICHLKKSEMEQKFQNYKGRVVLRGDIVKDDSGSFAVFTEQGSSASQMTAAKSNGHHLQIAWFRRTSSRRSISLHSSKNERRSKIVKRPKSECPDIWIRLPRHTWLKSCMVTHLLDCCGKDSSRKFYWDLDWKKYRVGNACSFTEN